VTALSMTEWMELSRHHCKLRVGLVAAVTLEASVPYCGPQFLAIAGADSPGGILLEWHLRCCGAQAEELPAAGSGGAVLPVVRPPALLPPAALLRLPATGQPL
jgi:hypothetical protein